MIFYMLIVFNVATSVLCRTEEVRPLPVNHCKQNSTDYIACLKTTVEELWPEAAIGYPQIDLPSLDPLFYDYSKAAFNIGELYGELIVSNIIITGLKNMHFLSIGVYNHNDSYHFEGDVLIPRLFLDGDCNATGYIGSLGIRMGGKGRFNTTVENVRASAYITGHAENDTLLVLDHFRINPTVEKLKIHISDYFEGNKELNDLVELFMNEFWPPLYRRLIPTLIDVIDHWATNFCNRVLSNLSLSQIFP